MNSAMELLPKIDLLESIYLVFINPRLFIIHITLFYYYFLFIIYSYSVLMLYYIAFYEVIHRPYILESYIIYIFVLSFSHPSIYLHLFIFASQPINKIISINKIFYRKGFSCSCCNYMIDPPISYSDCFLGYRYYEAIS
uniref:Uncharacterized protein n=1 Tax=Alpinia oxyphylla TaxID=125261 RepID=A0A286MFR7_9LILI|nr:hypothetical protein [Alpinia oxyphylla]ASW20479.1 hypothetical protein [Alpinia oxyphylla]